jgi:tetratricopeptide (TPR) repeat protein
MHNSFRYRNRKEYHGRKLAITLQRVLLLAICISGVIPRHQVSAQSKRPGTEKSPLCTRDNAFDMIKQQVDLAKTFNKTVQRITVLIRAADLLWPYQHDKARAAFTEAFELATEHEKEIERKGPRSIILRMQIPDQRYVVVRAVAKRDSAWAKELTRQMLKVDTHADEASSARDSFNDLLTAERLLHTANQMISTDINAALDLARASLNYPASPMLTRFLYRFAEVDQQGADQMYAQALAVYGDKPMREFLYLQAYPFAWRDTLNTPIFVFLYEVPANFMTNQSLQRRFVQVLLRRAQQALEVPLDQGDTYLDTSGRLLPGTVHLLQGLIKLEPQVRGSLPDLLAPLTQAREKILVSLSVETQKLLLQPGREISTTPNQTFDEQVESAQKVPDVHERDGLIATAVLGSEKESLAGVIQAIDKISDSNLRAHLLEWLYFHRATAAVKDKQFEEAERLTSKVEGQEQRAYLHTEIAKGLLNRSDTQTHAREVLDEAITEAKKAGVTIFAARTLLMASNLYAKIDLGRSISVLADAINCINRIEAPDFFTDDQALEKTPERKGRGGQYQGEYQFRFYMPGLDPESAFREMAKIDFDTSLSQTSALTDKFQRAMSTLALADVCLAQAQQQPKEKPKKSAKP